jgi:hypothetical protein
MTKKMQAIIVAAAILCCFAWSNAFAKSATAPTEIKQPSTAAQVQQQVKPNTKPNTTILAPENPVLACARLSGEINEDKNQLRSVLGYMASNDCYNEPAASSATCVNLRNKHDALQARIVANQRRAREMGCR